MHQITHDDAKNRWKATVSQILAEQSDFSSLCHWFMNFAMSIWSKLEFASRHSRIKFHETTITQNLVFDFYNLASHRKFPISIFESTDGENPMAMILRLS